MNMMRILTWDFTRFQEGKDNSLSHIFAEALNVQSKVVDNIIYWKEGAKKLSLAVKKNSSK